jgi:hypothetical protein
MLDILVVVRRLPRRLLSNNRKRCKVRPTYSRDSGQLLAKLRLIQGFFALPKPELRVQSGFPAVMSEIKSLTRGCEQRRESEAILIRESRRDPIP